MTSYVVTPRSNHYARIRQVKTLIYRGYTLAAVAILRVFFLIIGVYILVRFLLPLVYTERVVESNVKLCQLR